LGIAVKSVVGLRAPVLSTCLYLAMGWLALVAIEPLWSRMSGWGLLFLVLGGLAYSLGVVCFAASERRRYAHFLWHLCVVGGSTCHVLAIGWFAR
jgi:hemolysin III